MDGVIINSEPLWREAEIATFKTIGLNFTEEMCKETMGMKLSEVIEYWHKKLGWTGKSMHEVEEDLLIHVTKLISEKGIILEGVESSIRYFMSKKYSLALASSSPKSLINTVLSKLNLNFYFSIVNSAEHLPYGKPHPEIYLKTAQDLNVAPDECLVIEDSWNGLLAAKSARMKTIVVPDVENQNHPYFSIADFKINSLTEIKTVFGE